MNFKIKSIEVFDVDGNSKRRIEFLNQFYLIGDVDKKTVDPDSQEISKTTSNALGKTTLLNLIYYTLAGNMIKDLTPLKGFRVLIFLELRNEILRIERVICENIIRVNDKEYTLSDAKDVLNIDRNMLSHMFHFDMRKEQIIKEDPNKFTSYNAAYKILNLDSVLDITTEFYKLSEEKKILDIKRKEIKSILDNKDNFDINKELSEIKIKLESIHNLDAKKIENENSQLFEKNTSLLNTKKVLLTNYYEKKSRLKVINEYLNNYSFDDKDIMKFISKANEELSNLIQREISDVIEFHKNQSIERTGFLNKEKDRIQKEIESIEKSINEINDELPKISEVINQNNEIKQLFELNNFLSNKSNELTLKNSKFVELEEIENRLDRIKFLKSEKHIELKKIQINEIIEEYQSYSYDLVKRLYPEYFTSSFSMKVIQNSKINRTAYPFEFKFSISTGSSEGVKQARNIIVDLIMLKYSKSIRFMAWDSSAFNGVDPLQLIEIFKEIDYITNNFDKQVIICINKFQITEMYDELLMRIKDNPNINVLVLKEDNTLLGFNYSNSIED